MKAVDVIKFVKEITNLKPTPKDPISPLGEKLFKINKQESN